jgi:hypothetical protein
MPFEWTPPQLFLVHQGVPVWHTYDGASDVANYIYTTVELDDDRRGEESETEGQFDIRLLPGFSEGCDHAQVIRKAIEGGCFKDRPCDGPPVPGASDVEDLQNAVRRLQRTRPSALAEMGIMEGTQAMILGWSPAQGGVRVTRVLENTEGFRFDAGDRLVSALSGASSAVWNDDLAPGIVGGFVIEASDGRAYRIVVGAELIPYESEEQNKEEDRG